jgi:NTE family protein
MGRKTGNTTKRRRICLALQGGGAHGAFTWGVLDRLLEEGSLDIEAVSGTSAGAMSGAVLVDGLKRGGASRARTRLEQFWSAVSRAGNDVFKPGRAMAPSLGTLAQWSPVELWTEALSLVWSPYDNPFYRNALGDVLATQLPDVGALNDTRMPYFFACATNVNTNRRRIFGPGEISRDALLASACIPTLFRSIEIDGQFYWDGGYLGNPALYPLRSPALAADVLIVWVNPLHQPEVPTNARAILDRQNEVTFNATLVQEIEAIDAINALKPDDDSEHSPYKRVRLHEIKDEPQLARLDYASKFDTSWDFLRELHGWGREAANRWLDACLDDIGTNATADMHAMLQCLDSR